MLMPHGNSFFLIIFTSSIFFIIYHDHSKYSVIRSPELVFWITWAKTDDDDGIEHSDGISPLARIIHVER